jgi:hypothetical protein
MASCQAFYYTKARKGKVWEDFFLVITGQDYPCQHIDQWPRKTRESTINTFFDGFPIDHLSIPDLILKLYTFNILLFEIFLQPGSRSMQEQQQGLKIWGVIPLICYEMYAHRGKNLQLLVFWDRSRTGRHLIDIVYGVCRIVIKSVQQCRYRKLPSINYFLASK